MFRARRHDQGKEGPNLTDTPQDRFSGMMDGRSRGLISNGHRAPLCVRQQQGGARELVLGFITQHQLAGRFLVEDGLKINSQTHWQFLEDTVFKHWYKMKSASFNETIIVTDIAPSHTPK